MINFWQLKGSKKLSLKIIIAISMILVVLLFGGFFLYRQFSNNTDNQAIDTINNQVVEVAEPTGEDIQLAASTEVIEGTIVVFDQNAVQISTKEGLAREFIVTDKTLFQKGRGYIGGSRGDIQQGMEVTLSYSDLTSQVLFIWYQREEIISGSNG